jgi:hypothetical protein
MCEGLCVSVGVSECERNLMCRVVCVRACVCSVRQLQCVKD